MYTAATPEHSMNELNSSEVNHSYIETDNSCHSNIESHDIKCLSLNVCGLRKRLDYPEFITFIEQYDLIALQETKTD